METKNIIVTGFGPFGKHIINASWEAVKNLSKKNSEILKKQYNVNLIIKEIPVAYDHVIKNIPELWQQYNPLFVVHIGVSYLAKCLQIETQACSSGYTKKDIKDNCPEVCNDCKILNTTLDVDKLCQDLKEKYDCTACPSNNAGRYLCEFIFYHSLNINQNKSLFIHVPDLDVYPSDKTAQELFNIICWLLDNHQQS